MVHRRWIWIGALLLVGAAVLLLQEPPSPADPPALPSRDGRDPMPPSSPSLASDTHADPLSNATVRSASTAHPSLVGHLMGQVVDLEGQPVPGAVVRVRSEEGDRDPIVTTTDGEGRYRFELPHAREPGGKAEFYRVVAQASGHVSETWPQTIGIRPGAVMHCPLLVLVPETRISGRVVDTLGRPVAGARVEPSFGPAEATTTDGDGRFTSVLGWSVAREVVLRVIAKGHAPALSPPRRVHPGDRCEGIEVMLEPSTEIEGWVVDSAGRAVLNARVWISVPMECTVETHWEASAGPLDSAMTDAAGRFLVHVPARGRFQLDVTTPYRGKIHTEFEDVRLMPRRLVVPPDPRKGVFIELTLTDESGRAVTELPDAVAIRGKHYVQHTQKDLLAADSHDLPAGCLRLFVEPWPAERWLEVTVFGYSLGRSEPFRLDPDNPLRLSVTLPRGGTVTGRLRDRGTAEAVVGGWVRLMQGDDSVAVAAVGVDGSFTCRNLRDGDYRLEYNGLRHVFPGIALTIAPGHRDHDLDLDLDAGGFIEGRVLRRDGAPVSGSMLCAAGPDGVVERGKSDPGGAFVLGPLAAGAWRVGLGSHPPEDDAPSVQVRAGDRVQHDLAIAEYGQAAVYGTIRSAGQPVPGVGLRLECGELCWANTDADARGAFAFSAVQPGRYRLSAEDQDGDPILLRILDVASGEDLRLDLELHLAALSVALDPCPGETPAPCRLEFWRQEPDPLLREDPEDGVWMMGAADRFLHEGHTRTLDDLMPGDYRVDVQLLNRAGRVAAPAFVSLRAGEHRTVRLRLQQAAGLRLRFLDLEGPSDYEVRLARVDAPDRVISDEIEEDGTASLSELVPGTWRLQVARTSEDGEEPAPPVHEQRIELAEGVVADLEIRVRPGNGGRGN